MSTPITALTDASPVALKSSKIMQPDTCLDSVKIVLVDDNQPHAANFITATTTTTTTTTGYSTENQQQQHLVTIHKSNESSVSYHHHSCPNHAHAYLPNVINTIPHEPLSTLLFAANSKDAIGGVVGDLNDDASTNSSIDYLEIEAHFDEDKISPIFEEDDDHDDDDDVDQENEEECSEVDVEKEEDSEFCASSRKSTYSMKSSASRHDNKLLSLTVPKQPANASGILLTTSKSFNDSSNNKLQKLRKNSQAKQQQQTQQQQQQKTKRWRGKFKIDGKKSRADEGNASSGSEKTIVQRVLHSLAPGSGKSTSSLKFGSNKINLLNVSHKSKSNRNKLKTQDGLQETIKVEASTSAATADQASNATTKTNFNKIITSLLRTTTI